MTQPLMLATWTFGQAANAAGWPHLVRPDGGSLDAVEQACRAIEADPANMTVGYGARPDASGEVTLDASIMVAPARCGSVCFVRRFMHPISIARLVMEETPHVLLAGDGAERLAVQHGMQPTDLLTEAARAQYLEWRRKHPEGSAAARPAPNIEEVRLDARPRTGEEDHDTVGVLAIDAGGAVAGACSTSGLGYKRPGRVGDSPIIGHGLYVDARHGAAVATGVGELIMGVCGTFLAVERMHRGASPAEAAAEVVRRVAETYDLAPEHQVGIITLAPSGEWSSAAIRPGFRVAVRTPDRDELTDPAHVLLP
jgi:isoaspartyl peptidase/L-asparaginase-like protein (Ntn-hydrolase superfamily)